jgi:hypothetical protein
MMMKLIIKDLSNKLQKHIEEKGGHISIDAKWANKWIEEQDGEFVVFIADQDGKEIKDAKVIIKSKT